MNIYNELKFFTENENWGDASRINHRLLYELDSFRKEVGSPIIISCGTQGQHSEFSQHHKGKAVDVLCPALDIFEFYLLAEQFNFTGIGIYVDWRFGGQQIGGLHLDVRDLPPYFSGARWLCCAGVYCALTVENLKKYKII